MNQPLALQLLNVRHLEELAALVLGPHGLQLVAPVHLEHIGGQPGQDVQDLLGAVATVVLEGGTPHRLQGGGPLQQEQGQTEGGGGQERARDVDKVDVQQADLQSILGKGVLENINLTSLRVAPE